MDRRVRVVYRVENIDESESPAEWPDDVPPVDMPVMMVAYLRERRRAIITELRRIEELLQLQSSLPRRERPH